MTIDEARQWWFNGFRCARDLLESDEDAEMMFSEEWYMKSLGGEQECSGDE